MTNYPHIALAHRRVLAGEDIGAKLTPVQPSTVKPLPPIVRAKVIASNKRHKRVLVG